MTDYIGVQSARNRGADTAIVIGPIEQSSNGDTLVSIGRMSLRSTGETWGRFGETGLLRLTAADRDALIDALSMARAVGGAS